MELNGKDCLVTGASSGLGLAVSNELARMGANTTLLCRGKNKGEKAIKAIKQAVSDASVELMICDFASMASIQSFIKKY